MEFGPQILPPRNSLPNCDLLLKPFLSVTVNVYPLSSELPSPLPGFCNGAHRFASLAGVKALRVLVLPECPPEADPASESGFFTHSLVPGPRPIFATC